MSTASIPVPDASSPRFRTMAFLGLADLATDVIVLAAALTVIVGDLILMGLSIGSSFAIPIPIVNLVPFVFGLLLLACVPWLLRGYGLVERRRTNAVYGTAIAPLPRRRSDLHGFRKLLHQWWLDASDSTPWRALGFLCASAATATVAGSLVLGGIGGGIAMLFAPLVRWQTDVVYALDWPGWLFPILGIVAVVIGVAAAVAYGYLDRLLATSILGVGETAVLRRERDRLVEQRSSAVAASADQRRRIERDLHDEVQPRLVSIAMTLGMAQGKLAADPEAAGELIDQAHSETKEAITELRRLVQGFQPAVLADRGLDAALSAVIARCPVPTKLDTDLPEAGTCSAEAEAVVYFAVSEALTNVAKHSRATRCAVDVRKSGDRLLATITDDGVGGASVGAKSASGFTGGLSGMQDRAIAAGGAVRIASPAGGPTTITVEVPCAS